MSSLPAVTGHELRHVSTTRFRVAPEPHEICPWHKWIGLDLHYKIPYHMARLRLDMQACHHVRPRVLEWGIM